MAVAKEWLAQVANPESDGRNTGVKTAEVLGIVFGVILSCASLRNVTSLG